ncbi:MAG: discoidin domain-containing protein, partial [Verrucomicrobia bacterium]|nr:discoidin domain-containing protein [Verrucomicrobiota bacterium]
RARLDYYRGLEEFIATFFETHGIFQESQELLKNGDLAGARKLMERCHPEPVIEQFARFSSIGGMSRGEQGLVVSMNTRWLSHIIRVRQMLGMEPIRYRFGPTQHDPLAQSAGRFTFHFSADHQIWQTLGAEETGTEIFVVPESLRGANELCSSGIESGKPLELSMQPILSPGLFRKADSTRLPAGNYRLRLFALDPASTAAGQRVFDVQVTAGVGAASGTTRYQFNSVRAKLLRLLCHGSAENEWNSITEIASPALATNVAAQASASLAGFEAARAFDGQQDTRWASRGRNDWIQFALKSDTALEQIDIAWFQGDRRQYRVEFLVSDDGHDWRKILAQVAAASTPAPDRVDLFTRAGGANRAVELSYPVSLPNAGSVELRLTPVTGKAVLCGAILEPVDSAALSR